jgi:formylmethanofuran dehydrogenase subunit C
VTAGTIVVGGALGPHPGVAMRRGSLVALAGAVPPASFADTGRHELAFLRVLAGLLAREGAGELAGQLRPMRRWAGDLALGGRGEILAPA